MSRHETDPDLSTTMADRIERTTAATDVTAVIRRRILTGTYAPGSFIRQQEVARELGVSRIPVREALAQLDAEGLVKRELYRGALVPLLSIDEIREIYELRAMIEPYLLRNAIAKISNKKLDQLDDLIVRSRATTDVSAWASLNIDFHRTLFEAAEQPLALSVLDNLLIRADRYLKMQNFKSPKTKEESDAQHQKILELVRARDVKAATRVLEQHIRWNADDVRAAIDLINRS